MQNIRKCEIRILHRIKIRRVKKKFPLLNIHKFLTKTLPLLTRSNLRLPCPRTPPAHSDETCGHNHRQGTAGRDTVVVLSTHGSWEGWTRTFVYSPYEVRFFFHCTRFRGAGRNCQSKLQSRSRPIRTTVGTGRDGDGTGSGASRRRLSGRKA